LPSVEYVDQDSPSSSRLAASLCEQLGCWPSLRDGQSSIVTSLSLTSSHNTQMDEPKVKRERERERERGKKGRVGPADKTATASVRDPSCCHCAVRAKNPLTAVMVGRMRSLRGSRPSTTRRFAVHRQGLPGWKTRVGKSCHCGPVGSVYVHPNTLSS